MYGIASRPSGLSASLSNAVTVQPLVFSGRQDLNAYKQQQSGNGPIRDAGYRTSDLNLASPYGKYGSGTAGNFGQSTPQPGYQQAPQTQQPVAGSGLRSMGRTVMTYPQTQQAQSQTPYGGYYSQPQQQAYNNNYGQAGGSSYYQHPIYPGGYQTGNSPDPSYAAMTSTQQPATTASTGTQASANPNQVQINTSIQPSPVYSADYTRRAANLAGASMVPSLSMALGNNVQEGVSIASPMVGYNAGRDYANQMGQAQLAPYQVSQQHAFANAENILSGQGARDAEALAWAGLAAQQYGADLNYQNAMQNNMLRLLQAGSQWWR